MKRLIHVYGKGKRRYCRNTWPLRIDVARVLGVPSSAVSAFCNKMGWKERGSGKRSPLTQEQVEAILGHFSRHVPPVAIQLARRVLLPVPWEHGGVTTSVIPPEPHAFTVTLFS